MRDQGGGWRPEVPGYRIDRELGRGGFAVVYRAIQLSVDRPVALKLIGLAEVTPDQARRFRTETRAIGRLSRHPHVVSLYDAGETPRGALYLAMELCPEGSLGDRVRRDGRLAPEEVVQVGIEVADALRAAHAEGIIHRDIKPDNLMIGYRGETLLGDFGIANLTDTTASATGSFVGSLAYAAPELLGGQRADAASDIYSLGATLFTLSAGRAAFTIDGDDTPMALIWRIGTEDAPPLPTLVPPSLASVIAQAMSKDPAARPRSAADLLDLLREVAQEVTRPAEVLPDLTAEPEGVDPRQEDRCTPAPVASASLTGRSYALAGVGGLVIGSGATAVARNAVAGTSAPTYVLVAMTAIALLVGGIALIASRRHWHHPS